MVCKQDVVPGTVLMAERAFALYGKRSNKKVELQLSLIFLSNMDTTPLLY
jgi:hypothetical protein